MSKRWNRSWDFQDKDAFEAIYGRFRKPVLQYVSTRVSDPQAAEEVTQEVFLKVYRFSDQYDGRHAFSTWLWAIARNTVFDFLRRKKTTDAETLSPIPEEIPSADTSADLLIESKQRRRLVRKLLKPLTSLQRRVVWMRVVRQCTYHEIARQLGLSLSACKSLCHRAQTSMGQHLRASGALSFQLAQA